MVGVRQVRLADGDGEDGDASSVADRLAGGGLLEDGAAEALKDSLFSGAAGRRSSAALEGGVVWPTCTVQRGLAARKVGSSSAVGACLPLSLIPLRSSQMATRIAPACGAGSWRGGLNGGAGPC